MDLTARTQSSPPGKHFFLVGFESIQSKPLFATGILGGEGRSKLCSFPISNEEAPLKNIFVASLSFHFCGKLQYGKVGLTMQAKEVKVNPVLLIKQLKTLVACWGSYPIIQSKHLSVITMPGLVLCVLSQLLKCLSSHIRPKQIQIVHSSPLLKSYPTHGIDTDMEGWKLIWGFPKIVGFPLKSSIKK